MELGSKDPGATRTGSQETESEMTNEKTNEEGLGNGSANEVPDT